VLEAVLVRAQLRALRGDLVNGVVQDGDGAGRRLAVRDEHSVKAEGLAAHVSEIDAHVLTLVGADLEHGGVVGKVQIEGARALEQHVHVGMDQADQPIAGN